MVGETGYCVKCKKKRQFSKEKIVTMKNGNKAKTGPCAICGTTMFRIMGK